MKRLFITLLTVVLIVVCSKAQSSGSDVEVNLSEGFYHFKNVATGRYISFNDTDPSNYPISQSGELNMAGFRTYINYDTVAVSTSCVIFVKHLGNGQYDLACQGSNVGKVLQDSKIVIKPAGNGTYKISLQYNGITKYLSDGSPSENNSWLMNRLAETQNWYAIPINTTDEYIAVRPDVKTADGQYYGTIYAGFNFRLASEGMSAYYVSNAGGTGFTMNQIEEDVIPGGTPVIIRCNSANIQDNKIEPVIGGHTFNHANWLGGVYCSLDVTKHRNCTLFDKNNMRILGLSEKGELAFISNPPEGRLYKNQFLMANRAYLKVNSGDAEVMSLDGYCDETVGEGDVFEVGGINYKIGENNTVSVTSDKTKYSGSVVIPNQVTYLGTTYSVTNIGDGAFYGCIGLKSINIPNSVTSIDVNAFKGCSSLAEISFPNNLISVRGEAFYGTAWYDNQPEGLIYVGKVAYSYKGTMPDNTAISIKDGTTGISDLTFRNCRGLTSITIPNSVTSIGEWAFHECGNLTSITLPESLTSIMCQAFENCNNLTAVYISDLDKYIDIHFDHYQSNPLYYARRLFLKGEELTDLLIPDGKTTINQYAFFGCTSLKSVYIPNSVTSICKFAFFGCSNLTSIRIPNSVTSIEESVLRGCSGLTNVISEIENPFTIDNSVFDGIPSNAQLIVPKGTKMKYQSTAGWNQFTNIIEVGGVGYEFEVDGIYYKVGENKTVSVTSGKTKYSGALVIPSQVTYLGTTYSVTSIGRWAFDDCSGLNSISIPISVTNIGDGAFAGCSGLTSITIPNNVKCIRMDTFCGCSRLTSITIPNSVDVIQESAFSGCSNLTSITFLGGFALIGEYAFSGCNNLNAVYISDLENFLYTHFQGEDSNPLYLAKRLFLNGEELTDLFFPNSVTSIPDHIFMGCSSLSSVTIPNNITKIGGYAFKDCTRLSSVISEIENPFTIDNTVFSGIPSDAQLIVPKGTKTKYQATAGWNQFTNIVEVGGVGHKFEVDGIYYYIGTDNTVYVIRGKTEYSGDVVIPSSVVCQGNTYRVTSIEGAFMFCEGLTSVTIPSSVTSIGQWAFTESGLTSIVIPNSVTNIGFEAFKNCGLTSVTIPNSVKGIGGGAFNECYRLATVVSEIENPFGIADDTFTGIYAKAALIVPPGTKSAYQSKAGWNQFANIVEIEKKQTIHVATAGTLPDLIPDYEKYFIEELTLTGVLNGTDLGFLREMAGKSREGYCHDDMESISIDECIIGNTQGNLRILDISNVNIVSGGDSPFFVRNSNAHTTYIYSLDNIIPDYLFSGCRLISIKLPNSISGIGEYALSGCPISSINITDGVTFIDARAFLDCSNLTSITVDSGNTKYDSRDNCNAIIEKSSNTLVVGCKNTLIPNSVTSIGNSAFEDCSGLTSITIPNSVTSIGRDAFRKCSGLTSISIPNSVTSIGRDAFSYTGWYNDQPDGLVYAGKVSYDYKGTMPNNTSIKIKDGTLGIAESAFSSCSGLTSITIPNSVTSIGDNAFWNCSGLTSITIPNSVTSIGNRAFSSCRGLTSVVSEIENPFAIDNSVFDRILSNAQLIVPPGKKYAYQNANGWKLFTNIVEAELIGYEFEYGGIRYKIGENNTVSVTYKKVGYSGDVVIPSSVVYQGNTYSVTSIGDNAFVHCRGLTSVTIPNSVTSIGRFAFSGCDYLTSVTIPNSVTSIGDMAFEECGMTSITIPNSVTSIGLEAFRNCSLTSVTIPNSVTSIGGDAFCDCRYLTSVIIGKGVQSIYYAFYDCNNLQEMILSQTAYENGIPESVTKFTTYSKNPMRVVVTSMGATSVVMDIYPIDDSGNTNEDNCHTVTISGLTPEQYITWKLDDENYGIISEKTNELALEVQPAKPTSKTKARLLAKVKEQDDDTHFGFEWLRYDAPSNMTPNRVPAPLYDGQIVGTLNNLNPDVYYKYRPYYKSDNGSMYYGEWESFITGDAEVFFEPETHTKEVAEVTSVSAQLSGVWIEGTEDIEEKGFEYWVVAGSRTRTVGKNVKKVTVGDNQTTITLNSLFSGTEYGYRSYVKTASGTTYGEEKTFKTISDGKVRGDVNGDGVVNEADANDVATYIMGKTPKGFNKDAADLNKDNKVNAADIVLINKIIKKDK